MAEQLSYVLVTPYALKKARLGGIVSRLLSRTGLELEGARLITPDAGDAARYAEEADELLEAYLCSRLPEGAAALLLLKGEAAVAKTLEAVGDFGVSGSIRDTFGDLITDAAGQVVFYEPAVIAPPDALAAERDLSLLADWTAGDQLPPGTPNEETTLVLIKPDNFRYPNYRPGSVIDVFSRAGLELAALKVHHMSVAEACAFYGPVLEVLKATMGGRAAAIAREAIARELDLPVPAELEEQMAALLGPLDAQSRWESLVAFMSGARPSDTPESEQTRPGTEKIVALIYRGRHAVRKIRELLGATNPANAAQGTIRREFGESMMINAAHASDSPENARREIALLNLHENNLKPVVAPFFRRNDTPRLTPALHQPA